MAFDGYVRFASSDHGDYRPGVLQISSRSDRSIHGRLACNETSSNLDIVVGEGEPFHVDDSEFTCKWLHGSFRFRDSWEFKSFIAFCKRVNSSFELRLLHDGLERDVGIPVDELQDFTPDDLDPALYDRRMAAAGRSIPGYGLADVDTGAAEDGPAGASAAPPPIDAATATSLTAAAERARAAEAVRRCAGLPMTLSDGMTFTGSDGGAGPEAAAVGADGLPLPILQAYVLPARVHDKYVDGTLPCGKFLHERTADGATGGAGAAAGSGAASVLAQSSGEESAVGKGFAARHTFSRLLSTIGQEALLRDLFPSILKPTGQADLSLAVTLQLAGHPSSITMPFAQLQAKPGQAMAALIATASADAEDGKRKCILCDAVENRAASRRKVTGLHPFVPVNGSGEPVWSCAECMALILDRRLRCVEAGGIIDLDAAELVCALCGLQLKQEGVPKEEQKEVVVCSAVRCPRSYCTDCVKVLLTKGQRKKMVVEEEWLCPPCSAHEGCEAGRADSKAFCQARGLPSPEEALAAPLHQFMQRDVAVRLGLLPPEEDDGDERGGRGGRGRGRGGRGGRGRGRGGRIGWADMPGPSLLANWDAAGSYGLYDDGPYGYWGSSKGAGAAGADAARTAGQSGIGLKRGRGRAEDDDEVIEVGPDGQPVPRTGGRGGARTKRARTDEELEPYTGLSGLEPVALLFAAYVTETRRRAGDDPSAHLETENECFFCKDGGNVLECDAYSKDFVRGARLGELVEGEEDGEGTRPGKGASGRKSREPKPPRPVVLGPDGQPIKRRTGGGWNKGIRGMRRSNAGNPFAGPKKATKKKAGGAGVGIGKGRGGWNKGMRKDARRGWVLDPQSSHWQELLAAGGVLTAKVYHALTVAGVNTAGPGMTPEVVAGLRAEAEGAGLVAMVDDNDDDQGGAAVVAGAEGVAAEAGVAGAAGAQDTNAGEQAAEQGSSTSGAEAHAAKHEDQGQAEANTSQDEYHGEGWEPAKAGDQDQDHGEEHEDEDDNEDEDEHSEAGTEQEDGQAGSASRHGDDDEDSQSESSSEDSEEDEHEDGGSHAGAGVTNGAGQAASTTEVSSSSAGPAHGTASSSSGLDQQEAATSAHGQHDHEHGEGCGHAHDHAGAGASSSAAAGVLSSPGPARRGGRQKKDKGVRCPKVYHQECLGYVVPERVKWRCPRHMCRDCGAYSVALCRYCPSSYCLPHALRMLGWTSNTTSTTAAASNGSEGASSTNVPAAGLDQHRITASDSQQGQSQGQAGDINTTSSSAGTVPLVVETAAPTADGMAVDPSAAAASSSSAAADDSEVIIQPGVPAKEEGQGMTSAGAGMAGSAATPAPVPAAARKVGPATGISCWHPLELGQGIGDVSKALAAPVQAQQAQSTAGASSAGTAASSPDLAVATGQATESSSPASGAGVETATSGAAAAPANGAQASSSTNSSTTSYDSSNLLSVCVDHPVLGLALSGPLAEAVALSTEQWTAVVGQAGQPGDGSSAASAVTAAAGAAPAVSESMDVVVAHPAPADGAAVPSDGAAGPVDAPSAPAPQAAEPAQVGPPVVKPDRDITRGMSQVLCPCCAVWVAALVSRGQVAPEPVHGRPAFPVTAPEGTAEPVLRVVQERAVQQAPAVARMIVDNAARAAAAAAAAATAGASGAGASTVIGASRGSSSRGGGHPPASADPDPSDELGLPANFRSIMTPHGPMYAPNGGKIVYGKDGSVIRVKRPYVRHKPLPKGGAGGDGAGEGGASSSGYGEGEARAAGAGGSVDGEHSDNDEDGAGSGDEGSDHDERRGAREGGEKKKSQGFVWIPTTGWMPGQPVDEATRLAFETAVAEAKRKRKKRPQAPWSLGTGAGASAGEAAGMVAQGEGTEACAAGAGAESSSAAPAPAPGPRDLFAIPPKGSPAYAPFIASLGLEDGKWPDGRVVTQQEHDAWEHSVSEAKRHKKKRPEAPWILEAVRLKAAAWQATHGQGQAAPGASSGADEASAGAGSSSAVEQPAAPDAAGVAMPSPGQERGQDVDDTTAGAGAGASSAAAETAEAAAAGSSAAQGSASGPASSKVPAPAPARAAKPAPAKAAPASRKRARSGDDDDEEGDDQEEAKAGPADASDDDDEDRSGDEDEDEQDGASSSAAPRGSSSKAPPAKRAAVQSSSGSGPTTVASSRPVRSAAITASAAIATQLKPQQPSAPAAAAASAVLSPGRGAAEAAERTKGSGTAAGAKGSTSKEGAGKSSAAGASSAAKGSSGSGTGSGSAAKTSNGASSSKTSSSGKPQINFYSVRGPDGKFHRVEKIEGADDDEVQHGTAAGSGKAQALAKASPAAASAGKGGAPGAKESHNRDGKDKGGKAGSAKK